MVGLGCSMINFGMTMSRGRWLPDRIESVSECGGDGGSMSMEIATAGLLIWNLFRLCFGLKFVVGVSMEMFSTSESVCWELIWWWWWRLCWFWW